MEASFELKQLNFIHETGAVIQLKKNKAQLVQAGSQIYRLFKLQTKLQ